jgi:DNA polymerase-1
MEQNGFYVDRVLAKRYASIYDRERQRFYDALSNDPEAAWYIAHKKSLDKKFVFNPNSDPQMRDIIYGLKEHEIRVTTETGLPSVSWNEALKHIETDDPFFEDFRMHNLMSGMLSKYLEPPIEGKWFFGDDDRCRVNYNLGGASSGRLSSSEPTNLQNIPTMEKEWGTLLMYKPIKNIFCASSWAVHPTDCKLPLHPYHRYPFEVRRGRLVLVDYNGQELRVMASIANVLGMITAFNEGRDIHSFVTAMLFHVPEKDVKKIYNHLRYKAKWVNWTLLYGGDEYTLHTIYGIPLSEAKEIVKAYYKAFPEVLDFQTTVRKFVSEHGYVQSIFGRKLKLYYTSPDDKRRLPGHYAKDMRTAVNFPIQGAASDLLLLAMIVIHDIMRKRNIRACFVNTVHDSLVTDAPYDELEEVAALQVDVMENLPAYGKQYFPGIDLSWLRVDLKADVDMSIYYGTKTN